MKRRKDATQNLAEVVETLKAELAKEREAVAGWRNLALQLSKQRDAEFKALLDRIRRKLNARSR